MGMDEQKLEALLQAALYRHDCPEVALLGDYQMGRLAPTERDRFHVHLERCPHCRAEIERLTQFLPVQEDLIWTPVVGGLWSRLRETGEIIIRFLKETSAPLDLALLPVKGRAADTEEVLHRVVMSHEETGDADIEAILRRDPENLEQCVVTVRVQVPGRWPELAGTQVRAQAGEWQANGYTDEAGEVQLSGLPIELVTEVNLEITPLLDQG